MMLAARGTLADAFPVQIRIETSSRPSVTMGLCSRWNGTWDVSDHATLSVHLPRRP
jgi:hypothetical protein